MICIHSNTLPSILLDSKKTVKNQGEEGSSKRQISSVKLDVSRMKRIILPDDFEFLKDWAVSIEEPTLQVHTDRTR